MKDEKIKKKRKKGFTLIEILAVIIILGILMIIAVPAVTKYINDSRKNSYISSAKSIISGASLLANSESLDMTDENTTYYIPASYIKTEKGQKTPYGEFKEAYVGVIHENNGYRYFWISNDTSKQGIKIVTEKDNLDIDQIEEDITDEEIRTIVKTTGIEERERILILNLDGTWQNERGAIKNLNEDGEIEPTDTLLAIFVTGSDFNAKIKVLAGDTNPSYNTENTNIQYIKRSKTEPGEENKQTQNIISTLESEVPIYAWFDNGTIYWWSEDIKPNLNSNASKMFANFKEVKDIDLKNIKTNITTNMLSMFTYCDNLETLDLSKFDTSNVTSMGNMFYGVAKVKKIKGIEKLNTSNVTNMKQLFFGMESLEQLDISNFNTSKVNNMKLMFSGLKKVTQLNLSNFNTSNVTDMTAMFQDMESIKELDVSSFNTTNVVNMSHMFGCNGVSNGCNLLYIKGLDKFDTSNVTDISYMFSNQRKITKLALNNFDTSNVTNMTGMFQFMESIEQIDVSSFNTSKVTAMSYMFGCGKIILNCKLSNIIGLSNFDTKEVTTMYAMFINNHSLRTLDLSSFSTQKLKDTSYMFLATNLTTIYASPSFDLSGVTSSNYMFLKSGGDYISASPDYILTGGQGTTYSPSHVDKEYARIDDPEHDKPGYFTLKTN